MMLETTTAIADDPDLPGLAIAFNEARITETLRRQFQSPSSRCDQRGSSFRCRIVRVRHRPGVRAVIQYEWTWPGNATFPPASVNVTGYLNRGEKAVGAFKKLQDEATIELGPLTLPAVTYLSDLKLLLLAYPYDRNLPSLREAVRELPTIHSEALGRETGGPLSVNFIDSIKTVRYRAGLGATLRYQCRVPQASTCYCKFYATVEDAQTTWHLLSNLRAMPHGAELVCQPVSYCSHTQSILLKEAKGTTLDELLDRGDGMEAVRRLAESLEHFQRSRVLELRTHTAERQQLNIERAVGRLQTAVPQATSLLHHLRSWAMNAPDQPLVLSHRDLKLEHIFIDGDRVTLIDWDSTALAHPLLDVAMVVARLWARAATCSSHVITSHYLDAARQFLQHYVAIVPIDDPTAYTSYLAGAVLEVALGFFGRQEPNWQQTIEDLLQRTASYLARNE